MGRFGRLGRSRDRDDAPPVTEETGAVGDEPPEALSASEAGLTDPADVRDRRVTIPHGIEIATAWSWRLILIAAAIYGIYYVLAYFSEITIPLAVAALLSALAVPAVDAMERLRIPRAAGSAITVVGGLVVIAGLGTLVGQQVSSQFDELREQLNQGLDDFRTWLHDGPLGLTDEQISDGIQNAQDAVTASSDQIGGYAASLGTTLSHVIAGFFIALFATYFFLYQGQTVWAWLVRLFPRGSRAELDSSGRVAWVSLTAFVRATVLVAFVDAVGIATAALILQVPLALAIGVLVFLGSFVPIVGALVSGLVAVVVAFVAHGPVVALLMLGSVILVQQVEAHVLQPFLMGRIVSLHPLAIIVAIAAGIILGGVAGALVAVPIAACLNAVVVHLVRDRPPPAPEPVSPG